jgi:hypothetical protein
MNVIKGMMPIVLNRKDVAGKNSEKAGAVLPMTLQRNYLFPLPTQPLNGVLFVGEETSGVSALYKYAPRYKKWLLYKTETFLGCPNLMKKE